MIIKKNFYKRDALVVAREILGKIVCRRLDSGIILKGKIIEAEAYTQDEPSCHAYCGVTKRSKTLFEDAGILYVYFTYGMYYCANIVTDKKGFGSAVLIRAVEPLTELLDYKKTDGPAKFCKAFKIDTNLNEIPVTTKSSQVWLEDAETIPNNKIIQTTRIGITKATELPWRFYIKDNKFVSVK